MHLFAESLLRLLEQDNIIPILLFSAGGIVMLVWVVLSGIKGILVGRAREITRREIAAYVAEGSLDPDKAVALLNAGTKPEKDDDSCC